MDQLQLKLGEHAGQIYDGILNLNIPRRDLSTVINEMMQVRERLLGMFGVPPPPAAVTGKGCGKRKGAAPPPAAQGHAFAPGAPAEPWNGTPRTSTNPKTIQNRERAQRKKAAVLGIEGPPTGGQPSDYKSHLYQLVSQRAGRPLSKGEIHYEVVEHEGGFIAGVSSELMSQQYAGEEGASSRHLSQQLAAKSAIVGEFPDQFQDFGMAAMAAGAKRPYPGPPPGPKGPNTCTDARSKLMQAVQMLLQRTMQKGDIEMNTVELEPGNPNTHYQSSCRLLTFDPTSSWTGHPSDSRKQAENNAADVCMEALSGQISVATEEHHARKRVKREAKVQVFQGLQTTPLA